MTWHYVLRHGVILVSLSETRYVARRIRTQSELEAFIGFERNPRYARLFQYLSLATLRRNYAPPTLDPHNFYPAPR